MKKFNKFLDAVQEFDLFAPGIGLRYKSDNDYKTFSGAFLSIILICLFGTVFINSFVDLVSYKTISGSSSSVDENDPSLYSAVTPEVMFAIGLTSINMNNGSRYFNINVDKYSVNKGAKVLTDLKMVQCRPDMWTSLGDNHA